MPRLRAPLPLLNPPHSLTAPSAELDLVPLEVLLVLKDLDERLVQSQTGDEQTRLRTNPPPPPYPFFLGSYVPWLALEQLLQRCHDTKNIIQHERVEWRPWFGNRGERRGSGQESLSMLQPLEPLECCFGGTPSLFTPSLDR